jgi:hypothetical protein
MTLPPQGPPPEQDDPNKTTVFRPGESGFTPPPPGQQQPAFGQQTPPPPPPGYGQAPAQPYAPPYEQPQQVPQAQQPQYAQPQYAQSQYAQPQYSQPYGTPYNGPTAGGRSFGVVSALITVAGIVLVVVAFTAVNWFDGKGSSHFHDIHKVLSTPGIGRFTSTLSPPYFSWLGWVLLAAAGVTALLAAVPATGAAFRIIGLLVGLAAVAITFIALKFFNSHGHEISSQFGGYSDYIKHASTGFYLAAGGFLLMAIGAAIGSRRAA